MCLRVRFPSFDIPKLMFNFIIAQKGGGVNLMSIRRPISDTVCAFQ